jgi:hypothetical protein
LQRCRASFDEEGHLKVGLLQLKYFRFEYYQIKEFELFVWFQISCATLEKRIDVEVLDVEIRCRRPIINKELFMKLGAMNFELSGQGRGWVQIRIKGFALNKVFPVYTK